MQDTIRLNRKHSEELSRLKEELEAAKRKQAELEKSSTAIEVKEVSVPDIKETFKVYLATAIDATKRLCNFIYNNADDSNHGLFVSKAKQFFEKITEEII